MEHTYSADYLTLTIVITILILIFLAIREVICWYYKINERIQLQKEQNYLLQKLIQSLTPPQKRYEPTIDQKVVIKETELPNKNNDELMKNITGKNY